MSQLESCLNILNSPYSRNVYHLVTQCNELSNGQMVVRDITLYNFPTKCLCINFRHSCIYQGTCYPIPMELVIPQQFGNYPPCLYIRPDRGSKIYPIPNVVNQDGFVVYYSVRDIQHTLNMNQLLSSLDAVFGNTFPICGDPRAIKEDQCTKLLKEDYSQLYNKNLENYKAISTVRDDLTSTESLVQPELHKMDHNIQQLKKRANELTQHYEEICLLEKELEGRQALEEDFINAFQFSSDYQKLFLELESCEKCFRELNFILSASLCNSNVDELKDLIRDNGKKVFEASYLKQVIKAKLDSVN